MLMDLLEVVALFVAFALVMLAFDLVDARWRRRR